MTFPQDNPLRASDVRQHNEKMVLFLIYQAKRSGVSQSEVVQSTGLKAPTVFRIFNHLEEDGLIEPLALIQPETLQKKGRRPVAYRVRENALYTIGLEFWVDCITHDAPALQFILDSVGSEKVCLGSDYPFPLGDLEIGKFIEDMNLPPRDLHNIFSRSTLAWLGLNESRF